jgi:4-aminobutyrate aminotransferase-like enzyme
MLPDLRTEVPGPRSRALAAKLRRHESRNVTFLADDWPIFWERADGANVWDVDGNRFLDFTSAFGVASLGHTAPEIRDAITAQAAALMHAMGDVHPTAVKAELCEGLSAITFERWGAGPGKVILGNSGFEAVEAALKTSLLHRGKPGVLAFAGGYHGLGFGALAAGGLPFFREPFRRQLKEFATLLPYPHGPAADLAKLRGEMERAIREQEIGAVLVEPIQGRGGCVVPPREFLPLLRQVCDEHHILLVVDEILTGFNRTGALFACEHSGVVPDLLCLGKALTGGFPLSACVGRAAVMDAWPVSRGEALHTSTFLGNPLGCVMALAALKIHAAPATTQRARDTGAALRAALASLQSPRIGEVRGLGLLLGLELVLPGGAPDTDGAIAMVQAALRSGILLLADSPTSNVLSFTPPFALENGEVSFVAEWLQQALDHRAG